VYVASQVPAERREVRLCDSADVVWVLKAADVLHLRQRGVRTSIEVAQPWLDRRPLAPPSGRRLPVAVFVAALWREENATAAAWVVDQVWPTVHDAVPDAELRLAGARPPSWLERRVADEPGVVLTGFVEDLLSEYSRATVSLAPLADPSGLKIKVVQAMMHGLPVVARPAAVAGVADAPSDALGGVSDDPDRFAAHLVRLLRDPVLAASVGARAATWARDRFDFEEDIGTAVARYEQLGQSRQGRTSTS
jgi:glycosyltransferase involved in cell wall biosynthesis